MGDYIALAKLVIEFLKVLQSMKGKGDNPRLAMAAGDAKAVQKVNAALAKELDGFAAALRKG